MKLPATIILVTAGLGLASCETINDIPTERLASAQLSFANGVPAGTAQVVASGERVTLGIGVTGMSPGPHGFHLHTTGDCRAPDFTSAGGHLNPLGAEHGKDNPKGSHVGDLPNLEVGASRTASTTVDLGHDRAALMDWLFDNDGTAIVIHAGPDDYKSDPAGAAGPRIACGVLKRS